MDPDSVADPGCLSRILIFTHPGSWNSVPKTALKDRGEKKLVVIPFFVAINFTKLNYSIFKMLKKQIWARKEYRKKGRWTRKISEHESSVADPGSRAFLTPGSGIPDPKPIFLRAWWQFFGRKYYNYL